MPYICFDCGSMEWRELRKVVYIYRIDNYGDEEATTTENVEEIHTCCARCHSPNLLNIYFPDRGKKTQSIISLLRDMAGSVRLKYVLLLALESCDMDYSEKLVTIYDKDSAIPLSKDEIIKLLKEIGVSDDEIVARLI